MYSSAFYKYVLFVDPPVKSNRTAYLIHVDCLILISLLVMSSLLRSYPCSDWYNKGNLMINILKLLFRRTSNVTEKTFYSNYPERRQTPVEGWWLQKPKGWDGDNGDYKTSRNESIF